MAGGKPDLLGPILVDFSVSGDIQKNLADGVFSVELTNADIEKTLQAGHGLTGAFLGGALRVAPPVAGLAVPTRWRSASLLLGNRIQEAEGKPSVERVPPLER